MQAVGHIASKAAAAWHSSGWAELAGRWHDLGKYRPGFQTYLRESADPDAHIEGRVAGASKTHSAAGALHALRLFESRWGAAGAFAARPLAYVIAGHHAGLADWHPGIHHGLAARLLGIGRPDSETEYEEALAVCSRNAPELLNPSPGFDPQAALARVPGIRSARPLALSLWVRMLFSTLVDADFLDTEAFMDERHAAARPQSRPLADYLAQLDAFLAEKVDAVARAGRGQEPVMQARARVLQLCREKAVLPPGVFSLTVPTGGGKTLSSLAFALRHAMAHGKRRVVYAIPYTSIIEQTANEFRNVFSALGQDAVIEHHSQADTGARPETAHSRLACENWDAPLVVTTNVQLFESLFAARPSRCRKLHNLAGSVIVLDEAQLLPPEFLQPILDALHVLVADYGVTLLLCTATQPALTSRSEFDARRSLRGLPDPVEIIDNPAALFAVLQRVNIRWPEDWDTPTKWSTLVAELASRDSVLAIVNTRSDAHALTQALQAHDPNTLHLSAAMCGAHRKDVIDQIRARLQSRQDGAPVPLHVVSTQLVEAGVDLDFPVVYRAFCGLDSIAQAAGRCNREGRLDRGEVVVFVRDIPQPLGSVKFGAQAARSVLAGLGCCTDAGSVLSPETFTEYFRHYYAQFQSLDARGIVDHLHREAHRLQFDFRTAAEKFRLVDDQDLATVVVPYHRVATAQLGIEPVLEALEAGRTDRWLLRAVQRYTVSARLQLVRQWQEAGDVKEVSPGLFLLMNELLYDSRFGLLPKGAPLAAESLVQ
ncbi:CRISPR-associated helicase Cas3' [Aquabacterium sp. A7-Y]|uniref:CRISPR-associated helicase Cas3' n=1 Tax=Aquabacterium sp. A7-Y TaxID=1349605 RepID=UPI00223E76A1|nr:CRISPR-associated helicase Cas3' [Aquabacterium sp. A7-Y]MCW7540490.1 CRISPR-associated helicase Cas3' [Aquabacterium sp. A7-Y]